MWLFLATEILLFGGLFCAYAVYRANHPEIFIFGHHFLDKNLGALNTVVLIFSSFTIAWAVRAAQLKQIRLLKLLLGVTLLCAFTFLGVKYVEYSHKWHAGLLWARSYAPQIHHGEDAHVRRGTCRWSCRGQAGRAPLRRRPSRPLRRRLIPTARPSPPRPPARPAWRARTPGAPRARSSPSPPTPRPSSRSTS
jgi:hypothetical protein